MTTITTTTASAASQASGTTAEVVGGISTTATNMTTELTSANDAEATIGIMIGAAARALITVTSTICSAITTANDAVEAIGIIATPAEGRSMIANCTITTPSNVRSAEAITGTTIGDAESKLMTVTTTIIEVTMSANDAEEDTS